MNYYKHSTLTMRIVCAALFTLFTFFYLYSYQADILSVCQHVLSHGQTTYQRTVGAVLITLALFLLQLVVYAVTKLRSRTHALTYFPSLLLLAALTNVDSHIECGFTLGKWIWLFPLFLVIYIGVVWLARQFQPYEPEGRKGGLFARLVWINVLQMVIMLFLVGIVGNHDDVFHYRMRMERLMLQGKYQEALQVGQQSLSTDSSLACLRLICLEKTHQLGERLFTYPLMGGSAAMNMNSVGVHILMWKEPHVKIYFRGSKRFYPITPDHLLTSYLLDKRLDDFVAVIGKYYDLRSATLPKHYREALTLYTHHRSHPQYVYHSNVMDADFQDYQTMERKYLNPLIRQNMLHDTYGNTYWYYWQYQ